jgi:hypothetical protein
MDDLPVGLSVLLQKLGNDLSACCGVGDGKSAGGLGELVDGWELRWQGVDGRTYSFCASMMMRQESLVEAVEAGIPRRSRNEGGAIVDVEWCQGVGGWLWCKGDLAVDVMLW